MAMINPITSVAPVAPLAPSSINGSTAVQGDFASHLQAAVNNVESAGAEADRLTNQFVNGESVDLHSVALAGQKASLQFEMLLQVRNKVVSAYQEVMRIQL